MRWLRRRPNHPSRSRRPLCCPSSLYLLCSPSSSSAPLKHGCNEGQAHVTIGSEVYFRSPDGTIMPMKKGQPPPDLKYVKPTPDPSTIKNDSPHRDPPSRGFVTAITRPRPAQCHLGKNSGHDSIARAPTDR